MCLVRIEIIGTRVWARREVGSCASRDVHVILGAACVDALLDYSECEEGLGIAEAFMDGEPATDLKDKLAAVQRVHDACSSKQHTSRTS